MHPELAVKHKLKALERKKALLDSLIKFVQKHPDVAAATVLKQLSTKTVLYFEDYAIVRPRWVKDRVVLRLEKYSEDMSELDPLDPLYDPLGESKRVVHQDVSNLSDKELEDLFVKIRPEEHEENDDDPVS
jgi:hypothetical protein